MTMAKIKASTLAVKTKKSKTLGKMLRRPGRSEGLQQTGAGPAKKRLLARNGQTGSQRGGTRRFQIAARYIQDGRVDVDVLTKDLGMTKAALAQSLGFAEETFQRFSRVNAQKTQARLREFIEIVLRVEPWAGGPIQALGWYRAQNIPSLGDQTAEALVKQDKAAAVRAYLDGFAAGAYA